MLLAQVEFYYIKQFTEDSVLISLMNVAIINSLRISGKNFPSRRVRINRPRDYIEAMVSIRRMIELVAPVDFVDPRVE